MTTKIKRKYKRRSLGLNPTGPAQSTFVLIEFILLMFTMVYLLYVIFTTMSEVAHAVNLNEISSLDAALDKVSFLLLVRVSLIFLVVFIIHVIVGLFYLHRLTGPLVRIRSVLLDAADGRAPRYPILFRKGDFPQDVSEALTRMLRRLDYLERK